MSEKLKAVAYLRISNNNGKPDGVSIEGQRESILKKAVELNCDVEFFIDDGVRAKAKRRPAFNKMLEKIDTGEYSYLMVNDNTRLARSLLLHIQIVYVLLPKLKMKYISCNEAFDFSNMFGKHAFYQNAQFAEMYSDFVRERVLASQHTRRMNGTLICGSMKFGYTKLKDGKVIKTEDGQTTINKIIELRDSGLTYTQIRRKLNELGIKTSVGGYWHNSTIRGVYLREKPLLHSRAC